MQDCDKNSKFVLHTYGISQLTVNDVGEEMYLEEM